jgi:chemotaxis signal transduction protein
MSDVHVRVRVGGEDYALRVDGVLEIGELGEVSPIPGARPEVLGVRNLRGQVIPVFDLATLFALGGAGEPDRIVVVEDGDLRAGFAVEGIVDVGALPDATAAAESDYLSGATLIEGALVGVIDLPAVLEALAPDEAAA